MNKEIKDKLGNAGFRDIGQPDWSILKTTKLYKIYINHNNSRVAVDDLNGSLVLSGGPFKDLEELNKICFPFNGCKDLNFEAKSYKWEECLDATEGYYISSDSCIVPEKGSKGATARNTYPNQKNAISGLAVPQLMQICKEINEDFPRTDTGYSYFVVHSSHGLDVISNDASVKINHLSMNSPTAARKLIETNTPLLKQYFEID